MKTPREIAQEILGPVADEATGYAPTKDQYDLLAACEAAITQACADKDAMIAGLQMEIAGGVDAAEKIARLERDRASWLTAHNAKAAQLRAVAAALSFDPAMDRDLETCARRVYHENASSQSALNKTWSHVGQLRAEINLLNEGMKRREAKIIELSARVVELEMKLAAGRTAQ